MGSARKKQSTRVRRRTLSARNSYSSSGSRGEIRRSRRRRRKKIIFWGLLAALILVLVFIVWTLRRYQGADSSEREAIHLNPGPASVGR